jgi:hypothetical protein
MSQTIVAPPSDRQRRRALDKANGVRQARAALKRQLAAGECQASRVILDPPPEALTMDVGELLVCQPRWGAARMRTALGRVGRTLGAAPLPENKKLGQLTSRQAKALADVVASWACATTHVPAPGTSHREREKTARADIVGIAA